VTDTPQKFVTKYGIFYPGEDKPRGELFDFMASAAMHLLSGPAYAMKAEIKPVSVPIGKEGDPCDTCPTE
jgi:hypothetical protein